MYDALRHKIAGDIYTDKKHLYDASTDWSLFQVLPQLVVAPKHAADIEAVVSFAKEKKGAGEDISITVRSAGTDMTGGPLNTSIILDMTAYFHGTPTIRKYDTPHTQYSFFGQPYEVTGEAQVLPGTYYRDFEKETVRHNVLLPCYPASKNLCTVGGMVANNGAGEKTLRYGQNVDFVQSLSAVLGDGNEYTITPLSYDALQEKMQLETFEGRIYREIYALVKDNFTTIQQAKPLTSKNAAGYYLWDVISTDSIASFESGEGVFDMTKLLVGAQGTTGIITDITYKLVDTKEYHDLVVYYLYDYKTIPGLVEELVDTDIEMLEMYDDHTFKIGMRFLKDFLANKGVWGSIKYAARFLPEFFTVIRHGIPKLIVLAAYESNSTETLEQETRRAQAIGKRHKVITKVVTKDVAEEKFWDFRHDSFKILTEHTQQARDTGGGKRTAPFIDDIAVNPEHLAEYLPRLTDILDRYELLYTVAGHLGNGNFHIIPLVEVDRPDLASLILDVSDEVYTLARGFDATLTAEHNDGIIRTPYSERMFSQEIRDLFVRVKEIFDPHQLFNPGKKVGGDIENITRYLQKK